MCVSNLAELVVMYYLAELQWFWEVLMFVIFMLSISVCLIECLTDCLWMIIAYLFFYLPSLFHPFSQTLNYLFLKFFPI